MIFGQMIRSLRSRPGYAFAVIGTLALGMGANSAIFSVLDAVLLRPLPYPQGEQLVAVHQRNPRLHVEQGGFAPIRIQQIRDRATTVQAFAGQYTDTVSETSGPYPERLAVAYVTGRFFQVFRVNLAAGRFFNSEEDRDVHPQDAVMISHRLWVQRFDADPRMSGKTLQLGGKTVAVAGVLPPSFAYPNSGVDLWRTTDFADNLYANPAISFFSVAARLKPPYTIEQSRVELATMLDNLDKDYATKQPGWTLELTRLQTLGTAKYSQTLWLLFAAVALLLLLACANVAALNLAHLEARSRELSVRTALGATRIRLVGQLLLEALALSLAGAVLGVVLAQWLVHLFRDFAKDLPRVTRIDVDLRAAAFTFAAALAATLVFALLPAWGAARQSVVDGLHRASRGYTSSRTLSQQGLITLQFALAIVLLAGAGLLGRTFHSLSEAPMGFDPAGVSTFRITAGWGESTESGRVQERFQRTLARLRATPGVESAALAISLPPSGVSPAANFKLGAGPLDEFLFPFAAQSNSVSADFFNALRIPILAGSTCRDEVRQGSGEGTIQSGLVNQSFVNRYLGGKPALDRVLYGEMGNRAFYTMRILGVVADVRDQAPGIPATPSVYVCGLPGYYPDPAFLVRAKPGVAIGADAIREQIKQVSPARAVYGFETLRAHLGESIAAPRLNALLFAGFASTGLLLAAIGLYAVMNFTVNARRREIGIRLAIGAAPKQIQRQIGARAAWLVAAGLAIGLPGAVVLSRFLRSQLYETAPLDPAVFLAGPAILAAVAAIAAYLPARRAAKVDPMESLRGE